MRTKLFVMAILLGTAAAMVGSRTVSAGQARMPGAGCKIVTSSNVEAANTSFSGTRITNNSGSTLYVLCPISMDWTDGAYDISAWGNANSMTTTCTLYYDTSATSYTFVTTAPYSSGSDRIADFSGLPYPPISDAVFRCSMGPSSSFYNILINNNT
jgi:hypothetical protein